MAEGGAEVVVLEGSDGIGGRVRTDERDGFLLDRGFQVYFTSYPVSRRHLDHASLDLRTFDPGATLRRGVESTVLSDPLRDPKALVPSLLSGAATFSDKLRTLRLGAASVADGTQSVGAVGGGDASSLEYLREQGFSELFIDRFFRPFYGGIFLDRSLSTSSRVLRFTFKMLATGRTTVPARGIGRIPEQLASHLPGDAIRLNSPVDALLREGERVVGARVGGVEVESDRVVVATDAPSAGGLTGSPVPEGAVGQLCAYFRTDRPVGGKKIMLNSEDDPFVNNAVGISNVSPLYAPRGEHLLSAVSLGGFELPDEEVYRRCVAEISRWYPGLDLAPLAVYRVPYSQFDQPPGVHEGLPGNRTGTPGLVLAGDYTEDSSINGSMLSGEKAAGEVLGR
ncbi:NAD(P)/FAD-dependent oxidoreductase [Rubrobacter marinus]|uniref:NAD(P)/FAD-dependent oxidoreductase n=1 Tax=Rubrobacter marinus TaxID=2653852 RepID=UPI001AA002BF